MDKINLSGLIKAIRTQEGLTQDQFGKRIEIDRVNINLMENKHKHTSYATLNRIMNEFDIDIEYKRKGKNLEV